MKITTTIITILSLSLFSPLAFADDKRDIKSKVFSKINKLKKQVKTNTYDIQALSGQIQNLPGGTTPSNDAQVQSNTTAISNLATQVQTNTNTINSGTGGTPTAPSNDAQVQSNTTAISNLNSQVQSNSGSIANLNGQVQDNSNNISGNRTQIQGNTGNINRVSAEAQANTATNNAQTSQIQGNSDTNTAQGTLIEANRAKNLAQDTLIQGNTNAIDGLTADAQALQDSIDGLTTQVGTVQAEVNATTTQSQTNSASIVSNIDRISALENGTTAGSGGSTPNDPTPAAISFLQYVPDVGTREFLESTSVNVACKIIRHNITRVDNPTDSNIHITETYTNGSVNCTVIDTDYTLTTTAFSVTGYNDDITNANVTYNAPGEIFTNTMHVGGTLGYAVSDLRSTAQITLQSNTVLAIESVSVPAGSFTSCLKIRTTLKSNIVTPNYEGVAWHCPGIGEVKRVYFDTGINSYITRELTSFF